MSKHTPAPWRIESDAQGPMGVMHPTLHGVAIAWSSDAFKPANGYHDPVDDSPTITELGESWRSERIANVRLIAAAPEMYELIEEYVGNMRALKELGIGGFSERDIEKVENLLNRIDGTETRL